MTINVVTGGAGFVAINLIERLLAQGEEVLALDNFSRGLEQHWARFAGRPGFRSAAIDCADPDALREAIRAAYPSSKVTDIWHLAANSDIPAGIADPWIDRKDTFQTTFAALLVMRDLAIPNLRFASSSAIYGDHGETAIHEDIGPLQPISNYGAMKLASEAQIRAAVEAHGFRADIFRFPNVVGVPATHGVMLDFIRRLSVDPTKLEVLGDGSQRKSYLHVEELVDAMLFIRERADGKYNVFNVGPPDEGIYVREIAEITRDCVAPGATIQYGAGSRGWVGDVPRFRYAIDRLSQLGWRPKLSSLEAVRRAVAQIAAQQAPRRIRQAVILAGGKGTRLAERLNGRPKPLVDVDGTPLLARQIRNLRAHGVSDVVVLVNHGAEQIRDYCRTESNFGLDRLDLIDDGEPRGTAGAVLAALDRLDEAFLVVYGDTLFNIDIARFVAAHDAAGADATLFLHPNDHPHDSDLVELDERGAIIAFHSKPHPPGAHFANLVNAAFYAVSKASLQPWRQVALPADFGADLFPAMLAAGARLNGYVSFEYIKDLGTPQRLDKVSDHLRRGVVDRATLASAQPCVFLDRDGTLNEPRGHIRRAEDLVLLPHAAEAVRRLNDAEYRVALVTNQPVLARGECTSAELRAIHGKLDMALAKDGAFLDRLYVCPHHPDAGHPGEVPELKIACDCRKPNAGMILTAARDLNADLSRSWMIGDTTSDLLAARRAGVRSILVRTGEGGRDGKYAAEPDVVVDDVSAAVDFILADRSRA